MSLIDDIMDLPMGGKILLAGAVGTVGVIAYVNRNKSGGSMLPADAAAANSNNRVGLLSFMSGAGTFGSSGYVTGGANPPSPSGGGGGLGGITTGASSALGSGVFGGGSGRSLRRLPPTPTSGGTMAHATRMFGR